MENSKAIAYRAVELRRQLDKGGTLGCILVTPVNDAAVTSQDSLFCNHQALLLTTPSA